jgi:hypothetical protein
MYVGMGTNLGLTATLPQMIAGYGFVDEYGIK